jgi:hypothetical protein
MMPSGEPERHGPLGSFSTAASPIVDASLAHRGRFADLGARGPLVRKVIVPASSSMIAVGKLISPAFERTTDFPFAGLVNVCRAELVSLALPSA